MKKLLLLTAILIICVPAWANVSDDIIALIGKGDIDGAAALIPENANLPAETGDLLLIACVNAGEKALPLARQLIAVGADVNARDASMNTPMCEAARTDAAYTALFLENGGDVSLQDAYGRTPLFRAAAEGRNDIIELLLKAGSDIHKTDATGNSALSVVIESDDPQRLQLFIDAGADMNAPTGTDGRLPIELAMITGKPKILAALNASGKIDYQALNANGSHIMEAAVSSDNAEMCSLILDKGLNINAPVNLVGNTALHTAASLGRNDIMAMLLDRGADINARNYDGDTPLMLLILGGYPAGLLTERGADVNMKNNALQSPLYAAARLPNRREQVALLCGAGADVRAKALDGSTPVSVAEKYHPAYLEEMKKSPSYEAALSGLFKAVYEDDAEAAAAALTQETVNARDFGGRTPLFYAKSAGMVDRLASAGADLLALDHNGRTCVFSVCEADAVEALKALLERRLVNADPDDYAGQTPLFGAGPETAAVLLEKGAYPDHASLKGNTPLFSASGGAAEAIIKVGADLEHRNSDGETPLWFALSEKRAEDAIRLIKAGADVNAQNNGGSAPIFPALSCSDEAVKALLEAGAGLDVTDETGRTPLIAAAMAGAGEEIFAALLAGAGDPGRRDSAGFGALYYAVCGGREDMVKALLAAGVKPEDRDNLFANLYLCDNKACHLPVTGLLASAGADVNRRTPAGTPLLFAVWFSDKDTVAALLSAGAAPDNDAMLMAAKKGGETLALLAGAGGDAGAANSDGVTALMLAAKYGSPEDVELLLEKGADPAAVSKANYTPLHGAVYNPDAAVAALLTEKGAAPGIAAEGQTPVYCAALMNRPDAVSVLVKAGADVKQPDGKPFAELCRELGYEGVCSALEGRDPGEYSKGVNEKYRYTFTVLAVPTLFEAKCVANAAEDAIYNGRTEWEYEDGVLTLTVESPLGLNKLYPRISGLARNGIFRLEGRERKENRVTLEYIDS
ncbi:MAG: ankyrin repeat domain-containing protein [Abditibacteriota bacterium]|nr:ankyrin repeat domain-containing protein [Abditibacteriota bacterium]